MVTRHVFVDESMRDRYLLVAAVVAPEDLAATRRGVSQLVAAGQRRLHMVKESPPRRRLISGIDSRDRRQLVELSRDLGCGDALAYEHATASQEVLLAAPDAVGWAWSKGGEWRQRVHPIMRSLVRV